MSVKVYVASPLGFSVPTRHYHDTVLLPALREAGLEPLDPWAGGGDIEAALAMVDGDERLAALTAANHSVAAANEALIGASAGVFAVLDGTDVDSGTAAEIGWAAAQDLPIVGWRSDLRQTGDNEAAVVNLQVRYFIERGGGSIESDLGAAIARLVALLAR